MKTRILTLVLITALSASASAAATKSDRYIVSLRTLFVQPNASAAASLSDAVTTGGGKVDSQSFDRYVITLPDAAVDAIKSNPIVKYLQRVVVTASATPIPATMQAVTTLSARLAVSSAPPWNSGDYTYDGSGNITAIGAGSSFTYDAFSRVLSAAVSGQNESYEYDPFGNLTRKPRTVAPWF